MVVHRATMTSIKLFLVGILLVNQVAAGVRNTHQGPGRKGNAGGVLYGRSRDVDSSWSKCKEPVCQQIGQQAEGLMRLKDLRNYIVETMRLMDSLVTSVDAELVSQGADLAKFVGPLCRNTHQMLLNITIPSANANMDMGVAGPLSQNLDRFPTMNNEVTGSKTSGRRQARIDPIWEDDAEHGEFDQEGSESRIVETYSSTDSSSNKRRPGSSSGGRQLRPANGNSHQYGPHGTTGTVANAGIPSTSGGGGGGGYGGANSISGGGGAGRGSTASTTGFGSGAAIGRSIDSVSSCRGVERGNTHWVPGLDGWCTTNCAAGHCPETHCVCGV